MREELERDPDVFLIGEDIGLFEGSFKVTRGLLNEFGPRRVVDTPISEAGFVGIGIGAAMAGLRPVVELMTVNFAIVAMDQIVNNAAKIRYMFGGQVSVPLVIRMPGGAGHQLAAQHSHSLEAWFTHVPGLKVACPSTPYDAKALLKTAIRDDDPVIFLESEGLYAKKGPVGGPDELVPVRPGGDPPRRRPLHDHRRLAHGLDRARGRGSAGRRGHRVRGHRPAHARARSTWTRSPTRSGAPTAAWSSTRAGPSAAWRPTSPRASTRSASTGSTRRCSRVTAADVPMPYARNLEQSALPRAEDVAAAVRATLARGGAA